MGKVQCVVVSSSEMPEGTFRSLRHLAIIYRKDRAVFGDEHIFKANSKTFESISIGRRAMIFRRKGEKTFPQFSNCLR